MERTLVLIKPDAVERRLVGRITSRFEEKGLLILGMKMLRMDRDLAGCFYKVHEGKPFYEPLVEFMTSGPIVAMVLEGKRAVEVVRQMLGATDAAAAAPGTIRGDWALSSRYNLVHASDSAESYRREFDVIFAEDDIIDGVKPGELICFDGEE